MPRAIWKGAISFGLVVIPVSVYPAERRDELNFTMLDRRNLAPVGYRRYNKETGEEVPWDEIIKGYEYEEGEYVVLSPEDFRKANVEATQTVEIVDFVDAADISTLYYEQPYFLEPGRHGEKGYVLLRETLKRTGKVGIAEVVIHTRQHLAAVIPLGRALVLNLLRFADELRDPDELKLPGADLDELGVSDREIQMAQQLVEGMRERWRPDKYKDEYRHDLLALIDRKIKAGEAKKITEPAEEQAEPEKAAVVDMLELLKQSIEATGKGRKPARAARQPETSGRAEKPKGRKRA